MSVPFTQYLRPNGRAVPVEIDMDEETERRAHLLIDKHHLHFDAEVLTTGLVSFTCESNEDMLSIRVVENGPQVVNAVKELVDDAYQKKESQ